MESVIQISPILRRVRQVEEDEAAPMAGLLCGGFSSAVWYLTGKREDGIAMCNVLFYHWDPLDQLWIEAGPKRPVVEGGILMQNSYQEAVAIRLIDVRGLWSIKVKGC
jgi:hypothetical protein